MKSTRTSWLPEGAPTAAANGERTPLRLVLPVVAGAAAAWVLWRLAATSASPPRIVVAAIPLWLALWLATVLLHALRWQMVLGRLGTRLPLPRLARLWLAARAIGSLVPSGTLGGEPVRAQLLVTSGTPAGRAAGAVALDRALELAGNMIVGPLCIAAALALDAGSGAAMLAAAASALVGLVLLTAIYVRSIQGRPALVPILAPPLRLLPRRWRAWARAHAAHADAAMRDLVAAHPRLVPAGVGVSLVIEALHLVELAALFAAFAVAAPLPLLLVSSMGIGIAHAVPVTASLGTLEATQVGLFTIGGEPLAIGLAAAAAIRLAETAAIVAGLACLATAPGRRSRA
ncbi:MAG: flippase-like domain-containing protein [Deltaproteobacteria bacterium]|nr:flippase-like domain-containing protein [Deltaproteobacteria bacterium]